MRDAGVAWQFLRTQLEIGGAITTYIAAPTRTNKDQESHRKTEGAIAPTRIRDRTDNRSAVALTRVG